MSMPRYGPVDLAVKTWLAGSSVAALLPTAGGSVAAYLAMPKSSPVPALLITLVSGGPRAGADLPTAQYRLSFDCLGTTRAQASAVCLELVAVLQDLGVGDAGVLAEGVYLASAEVLMMRWQPDPNSDTARYIVDALIATVT